MNEFVYPLLIASVLSALAWVSYRWVNRLHVNLLHVELAGRSYETLSEIERHRLNQSVNAKFHQSVGSKLSVFVLMYAYPTLYIGERVFGRKHWSLTEMIGGSLLVYFSARALVGQLTSILR
jgi:hypothetical protein